MADFVRLLPLCSLLQALRPPASSQMGEWKERFGGGKAFAGRWMLVALTLKPVALTHPPSFKTETLRRG